MMKSPVAQLPQVQVPTPLHLRVMENRYLMLLLRVHQACKRYNAISWFR
jgi:hypothetical protein